MFRFLFVIFSIAAFFVCLSTPFNTAQAGNHGDRKGTLNKAPYYPPNEPYQLYFKIPDSKNN